MYKINLNKIMSFDAFSASEVPKAGVRLQQKYVNQISSALRIIFMG